MRAPGTGMHPPLFERLASSDDSPSTMDFDRAALANSVRVELLRLLNTRRAARPHTSQLSIIDYGIADWTALQGQRLDDRRQLAREIRTAIQYFEPRLQLSEVEVLPIAGQQQRLSIRLSGVLRNGRQHWPALFVIEDAGGAIEVSHERLD